jgi:hypothetical protein
MKSKRRRRSAVICAAIAGFALLGIAQSASATLSVSVTPSTTTASEGQTVTYSVAVRYLPPYPATATEDFDVITLTDSVFGDTANFCGPFPRSVPAQSPIICSYPEVMTGPAPRTVTNVVTATGNYTITPDFAPATPPSSFKIDSAPATVTVLPATVAKRCKKGTKPVKKHGKTKCRKRKKKKS